MLLNYLKNYSSNNDNLQGVVCNSVINKITVKKGDIIKEDTDAIVNAENGGLMGSGGVDGYHLL